VAIFGEIRRTPAGVSETSDLKVADSSDVDLRHTFASWHMINGGDLYELAKILGHSNIKMTRRCAKLGKTHIARTSNTAREMWKLMEGKAGAKAETGS
jgi:integrase